MWNVGRKKHCDYISGILFKNFRMREGQSPSAQKSFALLVPLPSGSGFSRNSHNFREKSLLMGKINSY